MVKVANLSDLMKEKLAEILDLLDFSSRHCNDTAWSFRKDVAEAVMQ